MTRLPAEGLGSGRVITGDAIAGAPAIDVALRRDPAFGLFRRNDSLSANPTAQGISLRGVGPSGASRTLVLLDGVPLNDPFGGWVHWNAVPVLPLASAEIRPGGGSAAWGSSALGGVVAMVSRPARATTPTTLRLAAGTNRHRQGDFSSAHGIGPWSVATDLRWLETGGHFPLRPADRGEVDRPLGLRTRTAQIRLGGSAGRLPIEIALRQFDEERGNGTAGQGNESSASILTLAAGRQTGTSEWRLTAYGQTQRFASRFTTIAADRSAETPASDQFAVPATAWGGAFTWAGAAGPHRLVAGADLRTVRGETREDFLLTGGSFARRRHAGGSQGSLGAFAGIEYRLGPSLELAARTRLDAWRQSDGMRREVARADGFVLRDERFIAREGLLENGTVEIQWRARGSPVTFHASASTAHRLPTLNELYRPFRVGPVSTEANPFLRPEKLRGLEAGIEAQRPSWSVRAVAFDSRLDDAVGNVTLASGPGFASRQRINLERVDVRGAEAAIRWLPVPHFSFDAGAVVSHGTVARATSQPGLEGLRLAQAPRLTATVAASWRPVRSTTLAVSGRWASRQFEDDENRLPLDAAGTIDLAVKHELGPALALRIDLTNLLDADVPVARAAGGPVSHAAGRAVRLALVLRGWK